MTRTHHRILARLRKGPLHVLDWLRETKQTRLAARIEELRHAGHRINTILDERRYATYVLVREKGAGR